MQAYIDESEKDDLFVMAGYVARPVQWDAFSLEWSSLLTMRSPHWRLLDEYHATEMNSVIGVEQSTLFYRVIERHLSMHVSVSVRPSDIAKVYQEIDWPQWLDNREVMANTYFIAFEMMMQALTWELHRLGLNEPVEMIFDERTDWRQARRSWGITKRYMPYEHVRALLDKPPIFARSFKTMPLQAADLLAYHVRRSDIAKNPKLIFPWEAKKKMQGLHYFMNEQMLRDKALGILLACALGRFGVHPKTVGFIVNLGTQSRRFTSLPE